MLRRFLFATLLASLPVAAGEGPIPDFVPPGTRAIIGFHLRQILNSPMVQSMGKDFLKNAQASSPIPGVNPLTDVDDVMIATTLEGNNPPALVICHGRFKADEIGKDAVIYRGVAMKQAQGGDAIALLDSSTFLAGPANEVRAAIDRRETQSTGLDGELAARAAELDAHYLIWGVGSLPENFHPPAGGPEALNSLDRFDFGVALGHGMDLAATLHVRKPEDVQKLAATLQFLDAMSKMQPNNGTKIETQIGKDTLHVAISIPEEELNKAMKQQAGAIAQAIGNAQAQQKSKTAAPKPSPGVSASKDTQIVKDDRGNSVVVTLPGKK